MNEQWKQATPQDQLTVILMSLEGNLSNFEEGVIDKNKFVERAKEHISQIKELQPFLSSPNTWQQQKETITQLFQTFDHDFTLQTAKHYMGMSVEVTCSEGGLKCTYQGILLPFDALTTRVGKELLVNEFITLLKPNTYAEVHEESLKNEFTGITNLELIRQHVYMCRHLSAPHLYRKQNTYSEIIRRVKKPTYEILTNIFEYLKNDVEKNGGIGTRIISSLLEDIVGSSPYAPEKINNDFAAYDVKAETMAWLKWAETTNFGRK